MLWVNETRDIADCYALNVAHDGAWYSAYTEFFITRSTASGDEATWKTQLQGVAALAVDFPYVAAIGGYGDRQQAYTLYQLDDVGTAPRHVQTGQIAFQTHRSIPSSLIGRNGHVHQVGDGVWRRWALADL